MFADKFKIRASQAAQICGKRGLGETGKTYAKNWLKSKQYDKPVGNFTSKYTNKGNEMEQAGIDLVCEFLGVDFAFKNEQYYENEYFTGTPDVVQPGAIWDLKTSWSVDTFPIYNTELSSKQKLYYDQGQVYMDLLGIDTYYLCYTLQNTPLELVQIEALRYCRDENIELTEEIENEFIELHQYSHYPIEQRVKIFKFKRDIDYIVFIKERVEEVREYLHEIETQTKNIVEL